MISVLLFLQNNSTLTCCLFGYIYQYFKENPDDLVHSIDVSEIFSKSDWIKIDKSLFDMFKRCSLMILPEKVKLYSVISE
jgi:hypothetical protein